MKFENTITIIPDAADVCAIQRAILRLEKVQAKLFPKGTETLYSCLDEKVLYAEDIQIAIGVLQDLCPYNDDVGLDKATVSVWTKKE